MYLLCAAILHNYENKSISYKLILADDLRNTAIASFMKMARSNGKQGKKVKKMGRPEVSPRPGGILGFFTVG